MADVAFLTDGSHEQVVYVTHRAARPARHEPLPDALDPGLAAALRDQGIEALYSHQRRVWDHLAAGDNIVVATGTASGKSLAFALPTLDAFARDRASRALFVYPTKALAQDQARKLAALRLPGAVAALYDGDTPRAQRSRLRSGATIVLTNPDMLHAGILPAHERWAEFLHQLRFVVLDEAHVYRGVFGSHVAQVVRRLRRLCAAYGADPRFVLASATIANPQPFAERLVGLPFTAIGDSGAPQPERTIVLWNPPLLDVALGVRRSALAESSYVLAETVLAGRRAIDFAPTRKAAELVYGFVRRRLADRDPAAADGVMPYRAGYTPEQRREIERRLFDGELRAVVATSALELGIDVGSLDLALVTGFPGTMTSLWQRWGRAGRAGRGWGVLVAGQDALDQYFMREPERLLSREVEDAIVDLANPHILAAHLTAAAYERPLAESDETWFGEAGMARAAQLAASGELRRTATGALAWGRSHSPALQTGLRSASGRTFVIADGRDGAVLGTIESERVFRTAHPGAVYLHLGESYLVRHLDLDAASVLVEPFRGSYSTQAKAEKHVAITGGGSPRPLPGGAVLSFGTIEVTERVVAYQRREGDDGEVIDTVTLDLPEQVFTTEALWFTLPPELLAAHVEEAAALGALHAAEHTCIAVLPLYAMCDRWDVGGLSTAWHWQTDLATVFIYDGHPGGIGLTRRAFEAFTELAVDAALLIAECPCEAGCPSCVQSPKCGNLNEPLHKQGALALLRAITATDAEGGDRT
jgi:DEAD/DEAH box helicase domain-containing protein